MLILENCSSRFTMKTTAQIAKKRHSVPRHFFLLENSTNILSKQGLFRLWYKLLQKNLSKNPCPAHSPSAGILEQLGVRAAVAPTLMSSDPKRGKAPRTFSRHFLTNATAQQRNNNHEDHRLEHCTGGFWDTRPYSYCHGM